MMKNDFLSNNPETLARTLHFAGAYSAHPYIFRHIYTTEFGAYVLLMIFDGQSLRSAP